MILCDGALQVMTVLHCYNQYYAINIIINAIAAASVQVDDCMMTALLAAAFKGHLGIVEMMLHSKKVDVNQQNSEVNIVYANYVYL